MLANWAASSGEGLVGNTINTKHQIKGRRSTQPIPKVMNFVEVMG
jgi:hypothetical protein